MKIIKQIFYPTMEMNLLRISFTQEQADQFEKMSYLEKLEFIWRHIPKEHQDHTPKDLFYGNTLTDFQIIKGVCSSCGCTPDDRCNHPEFGPCWWESEEQNLCSHCANLEIAQDTRTKRPSGIREAVFNSNNKKENV